MSCAGRRKHVSIKPLPKPRSNGAGAEGPQALPGACSLSITGDSEGREHSSPGQLPPPQGPPQGQGPSSSLNVAGPGGTRPHRTCRKSTTKSGGPLRPRAPPERSSRKSVFYNCTVLGHAFPSKINQAGTLEDVFKLGREYSKQSGLEVGTWGPGAAGVSDP